MKNLFYFLILIMIMTLVSSCNPMKRLERAKANPSVVTTLNLGRAGLSTLPPEIAELKSLEKLVLFKNRLTELPPWIGELSNLKELILSSNDLKALPTEIGNLTHLEKLTLQFNDLQTLPEEIGNLHNLEYLDVQYNQLKALPAQIGKLKELKFLYLNNNKLTSLPQEIGSMESLQYLVIGKNQLTDPLPESIGNLTGLIELDVAYTGPMLQIPATIQRLRHLEFLYIDKTALLPFEVSGINPRLRVIVK